MFKRGCICLVFVALLFTVSQGSAQLWGGGGGPYVMGFPPRLFELNLELRSVLGEDFHHKVFFLSGGYGSASITPNIRIGGLGADGKSIISGNDRQASLSMGIGGFLAEYSIPWKRFQFFVGGVLGGGDIKLKISRASDLNWDDFWNNFTSDSISSENFSGNLSAGFFYGEPYLGIQYAVAPWAYLKIDFGYSVILLGSASWKESGKVLTGAPYMNLSNPFVRIGVYFGHFGKE
jgi:hypothetical protein